MAFTNSDKKSEQTRENPGQSENRSERGMESPVGGLPNSLMLDYFAGGDDNFGAPPTVFREFKLPNSQLSSAEAEADRLSAGIRGTSPDSVRREMGDRLHTDLSGIRFHSDHSSESRAAQMGARAWTSGRDVYFGKGGFEPRVAAHELVHTVQQSAMRGPVTQSVTPGTVQMWPWSKKVVSNYDADRTPEDIADNLFRVQAGLEANSERKNAIRNTEYSKAYDKAFKRITKERRRLIREEGSEALDRRDARVEAMQRANNKRTGNKDYVSNDDKTKFESQIRLIDRETYEEMLDRWLKAAEELCDENVESGAFSAKSTYLKANGEKGKNYKLYKLLIRKIDNTHANNENFQTWKNEFLEKNRNAAETIATADLIMAEGTSDDNAYLKSDEGSRNRGKTTTENKDYYKKIYRKKKTRLDRMAAVLRYRQKKKTENSISKNNLIDMPEKDSRSSNLISNDDSDEFVLEGLQESNAKNSEKSRPQSNINIISSGMKEKDDEISLSSKGMKENNDNIISTSSKDLEDSDNDSISKGALVQKVQEIAEKQKSLDAKNSADPNEIRHQPGLISNEVLDGYAPANPTMTGTKNRSGIAKFGNNIIKVGNGLTQLGAAIHDTSLNGDNLMPGYVTPSISGVSGGIGAGLGLVGTVTGAVDTVRNVRNVSSGGSHLDWATSGLDTLGSLGEATTGAATVMKSLGSINGVGSSVANVGAAAGNVIPGLNIATGAISMVTGGIEGFRGQRSINTIDKQRDSLTQMNNLTGKNKEDQEKLLKIFNQGRRVGELHRTGGIMKVVGGAVALGTGIALLTGPLAPVTAAVLGLAGAVAGITNFVYSREKKYNLRKDVTAEELGFTDWEAEKKRVRDQFPGEELSNDEVKEIILKSHGYDVKTRKEAFKMINMKRADTLIRIAIDEHNPLKELAEKVIGALGVHRKGDRYAAGAQKLLAEKMAG